MSDTEEKEVNFEETGEGPLQILIEGIDEIPAREVTDPQLKKTKEELAKELADTKKSLEDERQRTLEVNSLREIATELKNQPRVLPQGSPQPLPGETEEDFKKRFNEKFYDSPYDTMMEFQQKKLAPEVQRIMGANLGTSRKFLQIDPDRKETAAKYMAEIDAEMERIPAQTKLYDPDIYQKVHDLVTSRHIREIVDMRVKEAMEKGKPAPVARPAGFSERGNAAPQERSPRTVVLTAKENETRRVKGMSKEQYGAFLLRHPELRQK